MNTEPLPVGYKPPGSYLTTVRLNGRTPDGKARLWVCRCDCGNTKEVGEHLLKSLGTRSCGCLKKEAWKDNGACGRPGPRKYEIHGKQYTKEQALAKFRDPSVPVLEVKRRLRAGATLLAALTDPYTPPEVTLSHPRVIVHNGKQEVVSVSQVAQTLGVSRQNIYLHLKQGRTLSQFVKYWLDTHGVQR